MSDGAAIEGIFVGWLRRGAFCLLLLAMAVWTPLLAPARARAAAARPRLVCLIVIDQFRQDYLTRFAPYYGPDGFNFLTRNGASFTSAHYRHAATYTGPGHALIVSGAYPHRSGIVSNDWYNRGTGRREAILYDPASQLIGLNATPADDTSPRHLIGSTLGDQLELATGGRAKVVSVSMKDRAAILMGGRLGKAYWFHERAGRFISSTYYGTELPAWVQHFNAQDNPDRFFGRTWDRLLSAAAYETAAPDDATWKQDLAGLGRAFPHRLTGGLSKPGPEFYTAFDLTPWATEYELEFARAAVEGENLGAGDTPDLLAISISANDYAGHAFGPYSPEVEDLAIRTDRMLADFFRYLSRRFGPDGVLFALTADHGVTPIPEYAASLGLDAGRISDAAVRDAITKALAQRYGEGDWISGMADPSIFLNQALLAEKKLDPEEVARAASDACTAIPGVAACFTRGQLMHGPLPPTELAAAAERSFHPERSGDLLLLPKPFYFWSNKYGSLPYGTTHGTPYQYDQHVPLLIAGPGIRHGEFTRFVDMADLAPTLAALLRIEPPAASEGRVIPEVLGAGSFSAPAEPLHPE